MLYDAYDALLSEHSKVWLLESAQALYVNVLGCLAPFFVSMFSAYSTEFNQMTKVILQKFPWF